MNLPGRLRLTTLGDLLGVLHREAASGILELVEDRGATAGQRHRIYLDAGLVDHVETGIATPRLGEILSGHGLLAADALGRLARRVVATPEQRAGEILVSERLATPQMVSFALRRQLRLRLEALFRLSEALVRFHVRSPFRPVAARVRPLTPSEFLHGRPRTRHTTSEARGSTVGRAPQRGNEAAYRVLGLQSGASVTEVRHAFRKLARDVHPDRHPSASPEERGRLLRRFAELSAAYHALVS